LAKPEIALGTVKTDCPRGKMR